MKQGVAPKQSVIAASLMALAGCGPTTDCDPSKVGFLNGIGCQVGGGYSARQTQLERDRNAAEQQRLQELANANRASAEQASAEQALQDRQARLATLRQQTDDLQRRLDKARGRQGVNAAALQRTDTELRALRNAQSGIPPVPSEEEMRAAEERRRTVLRMINEL